MDKKNFSGVKNPKGPYKITINYCNIMVDITIDNEGPFEYNVKIKSKTKLNKQFLNHLKQYLDLEGFYEVAQKHNLHW
jgi:hypothetical protein